VHPPSEHFVRSRRLLNRVQVCLEQDIGLQTLSHEPPRPGGEANRPSEVLAQLNLSASSSAVRTRLASLIEVLQSAAGAEDFLERASRSVVELIGLDSALVLLLRDGQWRCVAEHHQSPSVANSSGFASRRLLQRMQEERRTVFSDGMGVLSGDYSQTGVLAVVCAPICDKSGQIIGALYGDRQSPIHSPLPIGPEEATFAEALAHTIAVGLQRQSQEKEALEQRVRFDQFFSRELAEQLAKNPEILTAKDALVTILIADIRGFSTVSERMGAKLTLQWIQDTLDELTTIVMHHSGVVDYIGDAIIAMWGAPVEQPDQARRACQAALDMQVALGPLNARWRDQLAVETQLATGIHTGVAQVGNIGSRRKFKYGALGHTVNLASRVQGATKHLRTSLLITKATHEALGGGFVTRRIGAVQVVNIEEPVQVYEIRLVDDERERLLCQLYEKALGEFEAQQFRRAARTLGDYIPNYEDDGPSHICCGAPSMAWSSPLPRSMPLGSCPENKCLGALTGVSGDLGDQPHAVDGLGGVVSAAGFETFFAVARHGMSRQRDNRPRVAQACGVARWRRNRRAPAFACP